MAYTDKDEADLKVIASGKAGYFSDEYGRQLKGKKRDADAKPKRICKYSSVREKEATWRA